MLENITSIISDQDRDIFSGRSAASCPPQTGFNAFAFLAFILLTIDTLMNINNNLNNNNNNRNNNNRNNNNNNRYEQMNMNMNSRKKKSLDSDSLTAMESVEKMMIEESVSPWDKRIFQELLAEGSGLGVMEKWMTSVARAHPECLLAIPCMTSQEWGWYPDQQCLSKQSCPLFQ